MTRGEEIINAGIDYTLSIRPKVVCGDAFADDAKELNRNRYFEAGAIWSDQHPHWVSVKDYTKDELPPLIDKNNPYGESVQALFVVVLDGVQYINKGTFDYDTGVWHSLDMQCSFCKENVTHWMSLPAPPEEETKWTEHTLQRDKDGFLVGEVSDLDAYLPFEVHDNRHDTWEVIEDDSALVDWSGDIDTKPRYDRIRTIRRVISKKETSTSEKPTNCTISTPGHIQVASDAIGKEGGEE